MKKKRKTWNAVINQSKRYSMPTEHIKQLPPTRLPHASVGRSDDFILKLCLWSIKKCNKARKNEIKGAKFLSGEKSHHLPDHQKPKCEMCERISAWIFIKTQLIPPPKSFSELHCTGGQTRVMQESSGPNALKKKKERDSSPCSACQPSEDIRSCCH